MEKINMPDFTKEDYLLSSAPFEWLYSHKHDALQMSQLKSMMAENAKNVGVKNFTTLFKDYIAVVNAKNKTTSLSTTDFQDQAFELECNGWRCDDSGIHGVDRLGYDVTACNHPILITQRLVNIDTKIEKLELSFSKGRGWKHLISDKKTLASNNSILQLADYGVAVNSENSKYLVKYLTDIEHLNYASIPEFSSVGRLGWIDEHGFSPYVENLIFDGDLSFKHYFESIQQKGKFEKWLALAKDVRENGSIPARLILAASFSSVLVEKCGGLPFFVHLWGGTETGKTVGLMLAASVWANPEMGKYIHSFNGTTVAQELAAGFVNSLPLILDELQIVKEKKDFDNMIYQLSEGVGRSRGAKAGGLQRVSSWNNCILTTGEQPISNGNSGGGAVNRIIEINCEEVKLFADGPAVVDVLKKNHGHAGKMFIDGLMDDANMDMAKSLQKTIYKELSSKNSITEKQCLAASMILTADQMATMLIFKDECELDYKDIVPFLSSKESVSVGVRAFDWLCGWIAQNGNKFKPSEFASEVWGDTNSIHIYIIGNVFDRACSENGFNSQSFLGWLKRNGHIDAPADGLRKVKRIGGSSTRCVCLWRKSVDFD